MDRVWRNVLNIIPTEKGLFVFSSINIGPSIIFIDLPTDQISLFFSSYFG